MLSGTPAFAGLTTQPAQVAGLPWSPASGRFQFVRRSGLRLLAVEGETGPGRGDLYRGAVADVAGQDHLGKRILHAALYDALQRPRAVRGVPPLVGEPVACLRVERQFDLAVL